MMERLARSMYHRHEIHREMRTKTQPSRATQLPGEVLCANIDLLRRFDITTIATNNTFLFSFSFLFLFFKFTSVRSGVSNSSVLVATGPLHSPNAMNSLSLRSALRASDLTTALLQKPSILARRSLVRPSLHARHH